MPTPPPAREVSIGSVTVLAKQAATTPSKALPPFSMACFAASAVSLFPHETVYIDIVHVPVRLVHEGDRLVLFRKVFYHCDEDFGRVDFIGLIEMLFHSVYTPSSDVYNIQLDLTLRGAIDPAAFERTWRQLTDRHGALRTAFVWEDLDQPFFHPQHQICGIGNGSHRREVNPELLGEGDLENEVSLIQIGMIDLPVSWMLPTSRP